MTRINTFIAALGFFAIQSCGFQPIYATPADGSAPLNQLVVVRSVAAPDTILPMITDALNDRIVLKKGQSPKYELYVEASERAERLAVQIDATVTRYNYRLIAKYVLVNLDTGKRTRGAAQSVTSYNIVTSQYSTLFAEKTAQEKAARQLAIEIERDLLIRFSEIEDSTEEEDKPVLPGEMPLDPETDILVDDSELSGIFEPNERR